MSDIAALTKAAERILEVDTWYGRTLEIQDVELIRALALAVGRERLAAYDEEMRGNWGDDWVAEEVKA